MINPLAKATSDMLEILTPLNAEERMRVLHASLALLGEELPSRNANSGKGARLAEGGSNSDDDIDAPLAPPAKAWVKKNNLTIEQMEHYFHFDQGKVKVIAQLGSSKAKREQTANSYLAQGAAAFMATGEASFTDDDARALCEHLGCYDQGNHARNVKALGNKLTGSKSSGWKLTAPGLTAVAELIKG